MGSVNIDNTGSGSAVTLSSDGTSLLLDGTAIGGGGGGGGGASTVVTKADAYTVGSSDLGYILIFTGSWNEYATLGSAATLGSGFYVTIMNQSGNTHVINRTGSDTFTNNGSTGDTTYKLASGASVTLVSDGTSKWLSKSISPYLYAECNNNSGDFNPVATGSGSVALGRFSIAYGTTSFAAGGNSSLSGSITNGSGAVALGGSYASGSNSFATAISTNSSSYGAVGANSVAVGQNARAAQSNAIALGGSSLANGVYSFAFNGTSIGAYSVALGGTASGSVAVSLKGATASGDRSLAVGFRAVSSRFGQKAFANGRFAADGDAQGSMFILRAATTDATATVLTADQGAAASTNQIVAASDTCITFDGTITAMQNGAQAYASWKIEGLLVNDGGTTTLANSATTVIQNLSSWGMALSADNTNNALAITCTGEASHNIRWVANIRTTEVTYA